MSLEEINSSRRSLIQLMMKIVVRCQFKLLHKNADAEESFQLDNSKETHFLDASQESNWSET